MASKIFNYAKQQFANGGIDWDTHDIRAILCMSNTTCDTANDAINTVDDLTLDECDGANYVRKALSNEAVNLDDTNDRAECDADDVTWTALGVGTRATQGVLLIKHVTNDTDSIPIAWIEFASNVTHDGTNFQIQWNSEGILNLT